MFDKKFFNYFLIFLALNLLLYLFIYFFHGFYPFHEGNYIYNAHHFLEDPRIKGGEFNFLRALGQYDAQWYLKIASDGYPKNPSNVNIEDKSAMDGLTYAFFPLYPLTIALVNFFVNDIEGSAFILSNFLLMINFISLYYVVTKLYDREVAYKTCFLLFFFPFSIFYRSYFTEGLFLLFFIWFAYFFIKAKYFYAAVLLGFANVTRPNGLFLNLPFLYFLIKDLKGYKNYLVKLFPFSFLIILPLIIWIYLNFINTDNPLYFYSVQGSWFYSESPFVPLMTNFERLVNFDKLYFHLFHLSKLDYFMVFTSFIILLISRKVLGFKLWSLSLVLSVFPLLIKDTMSYSRYIIVVFPFFIYLAKKLNDIGYGIIFGIFSTLLFLVSLLFVNWYWIG